MSTLLVTETQSLHDGEPMDWWTWEAVDHVEADHEPQTARGSSPSPRRRIRAAEACTFCSYRVETRLTVDGG